MGGPGAGKGMGRVGSGSPSPPNKAYIRLRYQGPLMLAGFLCDS